jgi:hypothetical protein
MIVPDINLLLYAEIDAFTQHRAARRWWEDTLAGARGVGLASVVLFGFLRLSTNRRVFTDPLPVDDALARVRAWLGHPNVTHLLPGTRHLEIAFDLLGTLGTGANLTTDVQIAAFAIEVGGEVHSNDRDFGRFEGLIWLDPLEPDDG